MLGDSMAETLSPWIRRDTTKSQKAVVFLFHLAIFLLLFPQI